MDTCAVPERSRRSVVLFAYVYLVSPALLNDQILTILHYQYQEYLQYGPRQNGDWSPRSNGGPPRDYESYRRKGVFADRVGFSFLAAEI